MTTSETDVPQSRADKTSSLVLDACKRIDPESKMTSCTRNQNGRTVARILASGKHSAAELASSLQTLMPLASVTTEENVLTGKVEAKIVVPTTEDEWDLSYAYAKSSKLFSFLSTSFWIAVLVGAGAWFAIASRDLDTQ